MYKVVTCETLSEAEAEKIADLLLDNSLAACVQIVKNKRHYKKKGLRQKNDGFLLIIKTRADKYPAIEKLITENHGYDKPEIVAFDVSNISPKYAEWIDESVE